MTVAGVVALALGTVVSMGAMAQAVSLTGVNMAGGDFVHSKPGDKPIYGQKFTYHSDAEIEYFAKKGMNVFRVPFKWAVLQNELRKPLDQEQIGHLKKAVKMVTSRKLVAILDPHDYARYYDKLIGSPEVPYEAFADFWSKLAAEFKDDPYVWFGLMNEPHDMPTKQWFTAADAAVQAIRSAGATNLILVPGNHWTGAHSWLNAGAESNATNILGSIHDPLNYWAIDVHQYLDQDSSGTKPVVVSPTIGADRLKRFVAWARENKVRGFLGEFGVAGSPEGQAAITNMLKAMEADRDVWLGWTWWAAGPWWGDYMFSIEPKDGKDKPQMAWLEPFLHGAKMPEYELKVEGGAGGGAVVACGEREIAAQVPAGKRFEKWTGDTAWLKDPSAAKTTITMPFRNAVVAAQYR